VDAAGRGRITDFGLAMVTQNLDSIRSTPEDHGRNVSEILNEKGTFSKEADIFSFAMVMIEVRYEWAVFVELGSPPPRITTAVSPRSSVQ